MLSLRSKSHKIEFKNLSSGDCSILYMMFDKKIMKKVKICIKCEDGATVSEYPLSRCRDMREVSLYLLQKVRRKLAGFVKGAYLCSEKKKY